MASNTSICGICSLRQITKTSDNWCPECEEALCNECTDHHKVLKATRSHEAIPIFNYKSLPSFVTNIQQSCIYHNEQYLQYCVDHALPICFKCINDHRKCNVTTLENTSGNIKTSGHFLDLESRLDDLVQNIDRMKKDRKTNLTDIEDMKTQHVSEVKKIRVEINKHLDNLERQIIKDLDKKEYQCKEMIRGVLSSVKEQETMINQCMANFQSIKQYASDLQTFLGMREIESKVNENEQYLRTLIETHSFDQLDLVCKVDTGVQNIMKNVKNFGSIEIKNRINNIQLTRAKYKQAQLQVAAAKKTVNDVKLILQKKIVTNGIFVRGCCMSKEGEFLFTYHTKHSLGVIASDETLKYSMSLDPSHGYDLTFVDDKTVAITSGDSSKNGIDIINIENRSKIKFINVPGPPYGITRDRDSLFVCVTELGIYKVNTFEYTTSHVISCKLPKYSYVYVFADKIYYTDNFDQSVVCCDFQGSRVWYFKDASVLKLPRGITVDNDDNVYVVGENSSNVVILSNDGKYHKEILTGKNELLHPSAISLDKQNGTLLVANRSQTAFLYKIA
ncbi:uncharacterized protein LOC127718408 [Mytilus californianus]|uniref:uncharacterized protein LOC127718408 n=1 Tax=Mytilus californianus TaxID=6549 RepID=UPI0022455FD4|nr:uncharacterized protein LOC127718408 [Mytilus californianus]XP_052080382.1 uncharacterized protein LOC127718408 [Mytilus californianus]